MTFVTVCVPWRSKKHINPNTSVLVGKPTIPYKVLLGFIRSFGTDTYCISLNPNITWDIVLDNPHYP